MSAQAVIIVLAYSCCGRPHLLQYLGEEFDRSLCRGTCDNCRNHVISVEADVTEDAKKMIELCTLRRMDTVRFVY